MNRESELAGLPAGATFAGSSPVMTEKEVLPAMLQKHMAPRNRCALLVVLSGRIKLIWEDHGTVVEGDGSHPIVIQPERYHRLELDGPVRFRIDFYDLPEKKEKVAEDAARPGEQFLCSCK